MTKMATKYNLKVTNTTGQVISVCGWLINPGEDRLYTEGHLTGRADLQKLVDAGSVTAERLPKYPWRKKPTRIALLMMESEARESTPQPSKPFHVHLTLPALQFCNACQVIVSEYTYHWDDHRMDLHMCDECGVTWPPLNKYMISRLEEAWVE